MKRHLLLTAAIAAGAIGLQAATRYVDSQGTGAEVLGKTLPETYKPQLTPQKPETKFG